MWNRFKTLDPWLYVLPILLSTISVTVIYALTVENLGGSLYLKQLINALIGLVCMILATFLDYRSLKGWWFWLFVGGILSLIAVRFIGKTEFGAQSWFDFGFFNFQPSEFAKLIVIIALAAVLTKTPSLSLKRFIFSVLILIVPVVTVAVQPDFGTALIIALSGFGMLLYGNTKKYQKIAALVGFMAIVLAVALSFKGVAPFDSMLKTYQKDRLASFVDPSRDQTGSGYNVLQSVIAVGSGGLFGKGLGQGSQSQLNFLPVPQSDFIFAVISEAWGLVGSIGIIALLIFLISRILKGAAIAKDDFGSLVCAGIALKFMVEVLVNIGMNVRLMPVTGIPLPFLSYGGTTMFTSALCIGIVQSIVIRYKRLTF